MVGALVMVEAYATLVLGLLGITSLFFYHICSYAVLFPLLLVAWVSLTIITKAC